MNQLCCFEAKNCIKGNNSLRHFLENKYNHSLYILFYCDHLEAAFAINRQF